MAKRTSTGKAGKGGSTAARKRKTAARAPAVQTDRLWSVLVFFAALVLAALAFIPGQAAWAAVRGFFFGVFGWTLYLVWPALIYIAILIAAGRPWKGKLALCCATLMLLCGAALVFSKFQPGEASFDEMVKTLYDMGMARQAGGVMAVPLGLSLLCWTGRTAAAILLLLLLLLFVMILVDITPAEIAAYLRRKAGEAKETAASALDERETRRAERAAYREDRARRKELVQAIQDAENGPEAPARRRRPKVDPNLPPETLSRPRDRWNIDVVIEEDVKLKPPAAAEAAGPDILATARGGAFDAKQQRDGMADTLDHDVLVAAGRKGLRGEWRPIDAEDGIDTGEVVEADSPFVRDLEPVSAGVPLNVDAHRPLFDQYGGRRPAGTTDDPAADGAAANVAAAATAGTSDAAVRPGTQAPDRPAAFAPAADGAHAHTAGAPAADDDAPPFDILPAAGTAAAAQSVATVGAANGPRMAGVPHDAAAQDDIDDLVRRAVDGRAVTVDATTPTAAPAMPQPQLPPPYHLPAADLLDRQPVTDQGDVDAEMRRNAQILADTLESFGVKVKILDICRGPSVTRYEVQPQAGVKISRITSLADDIALNLASAGVRIEAPIPGKPAVGIEVPNKTKTTVSLRSLIQSPDFDASGSPLTMCLGRDIAGSIKLADLARMPHLLIAGSTGSGKSVCINSIIMSFLYKATPEQLRLILIDPKVVELAEYNGIPHLLMPVVTEPRKAAGALGAAVAEMERRYQLFAQHNVRDIKSFNKLAAEHDELETIPYIAIIIDELADLMMVAGKQVEDYICRIAQKARAAGMHLIVATQRPSVDVITGLIKANIPSRVAFAVSSQIDSRTILDGAGAEKLLGMGDMLFLPVGAAKPVRIQGTYVKDSEIERVIDEIKSYADARYDDEMMADIERRAAAADGGGKESGGDDDGDDNGQDPMLDAAIEVVVDAGMASTSLLQRKLKLGYARAARIMDEMEALHVIGPYEGSKPRQVLITRDQMLERSMRQGG